MQCKFILDSQVHGCTSNGFPRPSAMLKNSSGVLHRPPPRAARAHGMAPPRAPGWPRGARAGRTAGRTRACSAGVPSARNSGKFDKLCQRRSSELYSGSSTDRLHSKLAYAVPKFELRTFSNSGRRASFLNWPAQVRARLRFRAAEALAFCLRLHALRDRRCRLLPLEQ